MTMSGCLWALVAARLGAMAGAHTQGNWSLVTSAAQWSPRARAGAAVLGARGFVLGGYDGNEHLNDVWSSTDGKIWSRLASHAPWSARSGHVAVALGNRLFLMAGENSPIGKSVFFNDVWASSDGEAWDQVIEQAPWCKRTSAAAVASTSQVYILGGTDEAGKFLNDVWSSADGRAWKQLTAAAPWDARWGFGAALHGGRLVILGGSIDYGPGETADVWSSSDGATWTKLALAPWSARSNFGLAIWRDQLLLAGGQSYQEFRDVWTSPDGKNWTELAASSPWIARDSLCVLSFDSGALWVLGGSGAHVQDYYNDVWELREALENQPALVV